MSPLERMALGLRPHAPRGCFHRKTRPCVPHRVIPVRAAQACGHASTSLPGEPHCGALLSRLFVGALGRACLPAHGAPPSLGPCSPPPIPGNAPGRRTANKLGDYLEGLVTSHDGQFNVFATGLDHLGRHRRRSGATRPALPTVKPRRLDSSLAIWPPLCFFGFACQHLPSADEAPGHDSQLPVPLPSPTSAGVL